MPSSDERQVFKLIYNFSSLKMAFFTDTLWQYNTEMLVHIDDKPNRPYL